MVGFGAVKEIKEMQFLIAITDQIHVVVCNYCYDIISINTDALEIEAFGDCTCSGDTSDYLRKTEPAPFKVGDRVMIDFEEGNMRL